MANQTTADRKDRASGGDVTRAEVMTVKETPKTVWDVLNSHGPVDGGDIVER